VVVVMVVMVMVHPLVVVRPWLEATGFPTGSSLSEALETWWVARMVADQAAGTRAAGGGEGVAGKNKRQRRRGDDPLHGIFLSR